MSKEVNMNMDFVKKIVSIQKKYQNSVQIEVEGRSMQPVLFEGDIVTISEMDEYQVGDVLVFEYEKKVLLIHRLLYIENDVFFCKGDNAFFIEKVKRENVLGKAIAIERGKNRIEFPQCSMNWIELSKAVNQEFLRQGGDVIKTLRSNIYKTYKRYIYEEQNN